MKRRRLTIVINGKTVIDEDVYFPEDITVGQAANDIAYMLYPEDPKLVEVWQEN